MMGVAPRGIETAYTIIHPDKGVERGVVTWPRKPNLAAINDIVSRTLNAPGRLIRLRLGGCPADMFIVRGGTGRVVNKMATEIYRVSAIQTTAADLTTGDWRAAAAREATLPVDTLPAIRGTVIIFARRVVWS
jgi:hypothetical protein